MTISCRELIATLLETNRSSSTSHRISVMANDMALFGLFFGLEILVSHKNEADTP